VPVPGGPDGLHRHENVLNLSVSVHSFSRSSVAKLLNTIFFKKELTDFDVSWLKWPTGQGHE